MSTTTITPTVSTSAGTRLLEALVRWFGRSVVTREAVDQAWIDSGLGRLNSATLEDIGAPPELVDDAHRRESWKLLGALDATHHF
jgi:hypothetical protein